MCTFFVHYLKLSLNCFRLHRTIGALITAVDHVEEFIYSICIYKFFSEKVPNNSGLEAVWILKFKKICMK